MKLNEIQRRDFLKIFLSGIAATSIDWAVLPKASHSNSGKAQYDAVIIGSGLGGLSCAAAFARQGFKPLLIEQHYQPGGYATTFRRQGGFEFDVSLHSTSVNDRQGIYDLIPGFPEIKGVEFIAHPSLYRAIYPDYDITVPQKNINAYINQLIKLFPSEENGIKKVFDTMKGLSGDIAKFSGARGNVDMSQFPVDFPHLYFCHDKTWGQVLDTYITNNKLKAIISTLWGYYGLPPSTLSSFYYALPTYGYLTDGGYYPKDRSQKISRAFVQFIKKHGGDVILNKAVTKILMKDDTAYGVQTEDGNEYKAKVVVSNADVLTTFKKLITRHDNIEPYITKLNNYSISYSSFQVFLGLNKNLVQETGIKDSEIFYATGYDIEADYQSALQAKAGQGGCGVTLYDNIYKDYSPKGKNTITIINLQGFDHWEQYKDDYFRGQKSAYRKEKERMADILIKQVEKVLLPGLSKCIEVMEIGTPLTNLRYTGNSRGAIYGWNQTVENSGNRRLSHQTPVKNLYLSGAWTRPGGGYTGVIYSGLQCFGAIMQQWS